MAYETILYDKVDRIATITLNRPDKLNTIMPPMPEEIEKAVADLPPGELKKFRAWYEKFDSEAWDEQIQKDVKAGKLDASFKEILKTADNKDVGHDAKL